MPQEQSSAAEAIPLEIALLHSIPVSPTNPLLLELLAEEYPDAHVDGDTLRIPQRWMLWATPEGEPVWADYVIEASDPWDLEEFGMAMSVLHTIDELQAMPSWLKLREDLKCGTYSARRRIGTLRALASSIERSLPPVAVAWRGSRCLTAGVEETWPLGILSVRRAEVGEGILMDTLGGHTFGAPDFQCGFDGLEEETVADELLWRTLRAIEESETINDGDPVICLKDPDLWFTAREARSTLPPQRDVIALVPPADEARGEIIPRG